MIQQERRAGTTVPVVIRTHRARERDLDKALGAITRLASIKGKPVCIHIEEQLT